MGAAAKSALVGYLRNQLVPAQSGFLADFTIHRLGYAERSLELTRSIRSAMAFADADDLRVAVRVALEGHAAYWRVMAVWRNDDALAGEARVHNVAAAVAVIATTTATSVQT